MKTSTIRRLDDLFSGIPILVSGPVPDGDIAVAEQRLGRPFVPDYRWFVRRYGGAMVGCLPVLGLRQAEVMGDDLYSVVDVTTRFRNDGWHPTEDWLVISVDGFGNPIGIADDGRVWTSDHDTGEVRAVASSFEDFLLHLLDQAGT